MTPVITIESGVAAGTRHPISRPVARVGSDPQSDVCLPSADIASHVLTLEFRDESCLVHNRSDTQILVGARIAEPGDSLYWSETDILQLSQGVELMLDFVDASAQSQLAFESEPDPNDDDTDLATSVAPEETENKVSESNRKSNTTIQLVVIAVCVIGSALLLLRHQSRRPVQNSRIDFATVVEEALDDESISKSLIQQIQYAESQLIRGRTKVSARQYQAIRNRLSADQWSDDTDANNTRSSLLKLIQTRIAASN